jgi:hypothetical protein
MNRVNVLLGAAALLWACAPEREPTAPATASGLVAARTVASSAPLVLHVVSPRATDPAIDQALDDHYVWLDTAARSNHKLLVFLPGTGQRPAMFQRVPEVAARLGYHVIGLMYSNTVRPTVTCSNDPDPACYENLHREVLDGVDRSAAANVNRANSVLNRLTRLLQYLEAQYPNEGWSRFLRAGEPKWSQIAVAGHSQGGGQAVLIAKDHVVARVVMFSAVVDLWRGGSPAWVGGAGRTPVDRYWGIAHSLDASFPAIRASWDSLGLAAFGPPVAPEAGAPPYAFTHMLVTGLPPRNNTNPHGAPSNDLNTPLDADGAPLLGDAWRYLLTARTEDDATDDLPSGARSRE